jgi:hypothetical protein
MLIKSVKSLEGTMADITLIGRTVKSSFVRRVGYESCWSFLRTLDTMRDRNLRNNVQVVDSSGDLMAINVVAPRFDVHRNGGWCLKHACAKRTFVCPTSMSIGGTMLDETSA